MQTGSAAAFEALQRELSSRRSVLHFAHAAVSLVVALIAAGTAAKLYWDLTHDYLKHAEWVEVIWVAVGVTAFCVVYAIVRYLVGRRALRVELVQFGKLQALRQQLGLDDHPNLLPR